MGRMIGFTRVELFPAGTLTGTSQPVDCRELGPVTIWVRGVGTIDTGELTVEQADYDPLTESSPDEFGAWVTVDTIALTSLTDPDNGQLATQYPKVGASGPTNWGFLRVTFSDDVTGDDGAVQVFLTGRP